jgi:hypothetical protein
MSSLYSSIYTNKQLIENHDLYWRNTCMNMRLMNIKHKKVKKIAINWINIKFLKKNKTVIPDKQGIYMFVLDISNSLDLNGTGKHILYIGQTINLNDRFGSYFYYKNSTKPSDFLKRCMVLLWEGKLEFHYFETYGLNSKDLDKVEFDLIDSVVPPMNNRFRGTILKTHIKAIAPR